MSSVQAPSERCSALLRFHREAAAGRPSIPSRSTALSRGRAHAHHNPMERTKTSAAGSTARGSLPGSLAVCQTPSSTRSSPSALAPDRALVAFYVSTGARAYRACCRDGWRCRSRATGSSPLSARESDNRNCPLPPTPSYGCGVYQLEMEDLSHEAPPATVWTVRRSSAPASLPRGRIVCSSESTREAGRLRHCTPCATPAYRTGRDAISFR